MKKVLVVLVVSLLLSSCGFQSEDLQKAKQDLWVIPWNQTEEIVSPSDDVEKLTSEDVLSDTIKEDDVVVDSIKPSFTIEQLTVDQFIELDSIASQIENITDSIKVTWKTLTKVDKIIVSFSNRGSDFPIDNYTLSQFKSWDDTFAYNAKSQFKVLDFWTNEYIFEAFAWDKSAKLQLTIIMPEEFEEEETETTEVVEDDSDLTENISYEKKLIWEEDDQVYLSLPKSSTFGSPLNSGEDTITYSNINNFEIKKQEVSSDDVNCWNLTEYLETKINTWYYWNTCRDIIKDEGISYYVLRLNGDTYNYEKHYVDYNHNLYWVYTVKSWIDADKENIQTDIAAQNKELKEKNEDFKQVEVVDSLFKEIVR